MDTRPPIEAANESPVLSVAFNHDASRFSVGLPTGFCVYLSGPCKMQMSRDLKAGIGLAQMMGNANYLALVGGGRSPKFPQNKVIIWDDSKGKTALEITTLTAVRGVQLSRTRVVVVLQNSVRVYAFEKHPKALAIYDTADNMLGLCCLTDKYLVFPGRISGQIQVVHLETDSVSIIPAHNSSLKALQLSMDGELLATASEKGTLIRIFSTGSCARIAERRRGSDFATIFSLRFSPSGCMLASTSDKGSLHIFDIPSPRRPSPSSPPQSPGLAAQNNPGPSPEAKNKWGFLSNIPFGPFADVYSFASTQFDAGQEPVGPATASRTGSEAPVLGTTSRPMKGLIGWIDERTLVVVGAGTDARWEKYVIVDGDEGRSVVREGWKRYLSS